MKGLQRLDSEDMLDQFLRLWELLQPVSLSDNQDGIQWTLTTDGCYSAASAYDFQFLTRTTQPLLHATWRIKAEPKVKFYLWLLLQNRNWTADRLSTRGWPHKDLCTLCDQTIESAAHISLGCPFAREVWHSFRRNAERAAAIGSTSISIKEWWRKTIGIGKTLDSHKQITTAAYVVWNLWKERNRRTFEGKRCSPETVAAMAREETYFFGRQTAEVVRPLLSSSSFLLFIS